VLDRPYREQQQITRQKYYQLPATAGASEPALHRAAMAICPRLRRSNDGSPRKRRTAEQLCGQSLDPQFPMVLEEESEKRQRWWG
jgi:hypothetical protein